MRKVFCTASIFTPLLLAVIAGFIVQHPMTLWGSYLGNPKIQVPVLVWIILQVVPILWCAGVLFVAASAIFGMWTLPENR